jgi:hypothetical protein
MVAGGWAEVVVVVLTHIDAALTTWMALGLARVSLDMVVARGVELCWLPWVRLVVAGLLSSSTAGYGVQLMGRLRSDFEEFCEALEDMSDEDGSSKLLSLLLK